MSLAGSISSISVFFLVWQFGFSQASESFNRKSGSPTYQVSDSLTIQFLSLPDNPLLFSEVKKYIKEQEDSCRLFKNGFGFITISGIKLVRNGRPIPADLMSNNRLKDVELVFDVGLSSFYPHQRLGTPLYYAFVDKRLVLIFDQQAQWIHGNHYSQESQRKVKDLIHKTLLAEFAPDFEFTGLDGNKFKLSPERRKSLTKEQILELGSFTLQRVKTVIQHFDLSVTYQYPWIGVVGGVK